MKSFNVTVPEEKVSFFKEFLAMLGTEYTEYNDDFVLSDEQKAILDNIDKIPLSHYTSVEDFEAEISREYGL